MINKLTGHVILWISSVTLILFSLVLSPYKYEWEPELKQINDNSVLVLRLIYIILLLALGVGFYLARNNKVWVKSFYLVLFTFTVYKLISLFFL